MPGKTIRYGLERMNSRAPHSMEPHSGVGDCTPRPRYERPAADRIVPEIVRVV